MATQPTTMSRSETMPLKRRSLGLSITGTKETLRERMRAATSADVAPVAATSGSGIITAAACIGSLLSRLAVTHHRTLRAFRSPRHAYRRAQLHDRLIELPGRLPVLRHDGFGQLPDLGEHGAGSGRSPAVAGLRTGPSPTAPRSPLPEEHSAEHPRDIRVYRRHRLLV